MYNIITSHCLIVNGLICFFPIFHSSKNNLDTQLKTPFRETFACRTWASSYSKQRCKTEDRRLDRSICEGILSRVNHTGAGAGEFARHKARTFTFISHRRSSRFLCLATEGQQPRKLFLRLLASNSTLSATRIVYISWQPSKRIVGLGCLRRETSPTPKRNSRRSFARIRCRYLFSSLLPSPVTISFSLVYLSEWKIRDCFIACISVSMHRIEIQLAPGFPLVCTENEIQMGAISRVNSVLTCWRENTGRTGWFFVSIIVGGPLPSREGSREMKDQRVQLYLEWESWIRTTSQPCFSINSNGQNNNNYRHCF